MARSDVVSAPLSWPRPLARAVAVSRLVFLILWTLLLLVLLLSTAWAALSERRRIEYAVFLQRVWGRTIIFAFGIRLQTFGHSSREGAAVIIANHRSYLDIALIAATFPTVFLAKRELASWPLFGLAARVAGTVFVSRADQDDRKEALRRIGTLIENGINVIVFPEGTTHGGNGVLPFREGIFRLCTELSIPVIPVALRYKETQYAWIGDDAFVPHFLRTQSGTPIDVAVVVGESISPHWYENAAAMRASTEVTVAYLYEVYAWDE